MATKRKTTKSHSEREAEVARKLGIPYTKEAPLGAKDASIGRGNAPTASQRGRRRPKKK